jgi:hypothetical protein
VEPDLKANWVARKEKTSRKVSGSGDMKLNNSHIKVLRQLVELPTNKRLGTDVPQELIDLQTAGYAKIIPIGISQHLAEITDAGRDAMTEQTVGIRIILDSSRRPPARHPS